MSVLMKDITKIDLSKSKWISKAEVNMKEYIVPFTDDADMDEFERIHGTNGMLIRCENCKCAELRDIEYYCWKHNEFVSSDDYCSMAESKD